MNIKYHEMSYLWKKNIMMSILPSEIQLPTTSPNSSDWGAQPQPPTFLAFTLSAQPNDGESMGKQAARLDRAVSKWGGTEGTGGVFAKNWILPCKRWWAATDRVQKNLLVLNVGNEGMIHDN